MRIKSIFIFSLFLSFLLLTQESIASGRILLKEKTFRITTQKSIKVKASGADVYVTKWDSLAIQIRIFGKRNAKGKIKYSFKQNDEEILTAIISRKKKFNFFNIFRSFDYGLIVKIKAPENFNVNVLTSGGDINIRDIAGKARLFTSGGDVFCLNSTGSLSIKTSGGDVKTENHSGNVNIKTSGGDIEVIGNSNGAVSCKTSGGDIYMKLNNCKVQAATSGGDIKLLLSGKNLSAGLTTTGGDILIKLSPGFKADFNFKTTGGDISVNYPNVSLTQKSSSSFSGKANGGGKEIKAFTTGGDIILRTFTD